MDMTINTGAASASTYTTATAPATTAAASTTASATETKATTNEAAVYEKSSESTKYKPDVDKLSKMMKESNEKIEAFRQMITKAFGKQGATLEDAVGTLRSNMSADGKIMVPIDPAVQKQAQADVADGGYYSVDKTADRLLEFAKAISGGDPAKISLLKDAVEKGFKAAEEVWGGKLPDISQKTYDAVMKGFDDWEKSATASKDKAAAPVA